MVHLRHIAVVDGTIEAQYIYRSIVTDDTSVTQRARQQALERRAERLREKLDRLQPGTPSYNARARQLQDVQAQGKKQGVDIEVPERAAEEGPRRYRVGSGYSSTELERSSGTTLSLGERLRYERTGEVPSRIGSSRRVMTVNVPDGDVSRATTREELQVQFNPSVQSPKPIGLVGPTVSYPEGTPGYRLELARAMLLQNLSVEQKEAVGLREAQKGPIWTPGYVSPTAPAPAEVDRLYLPPTPKGFEFNSAGLYTRPPEISGVYYPQSGWPPPYVGSAQPKPKIPLFSRIPFWLSGPAVALEVKKYQFEELRGKVYKYIEPTINKSYEYYGALQVSGFSGLTRTNVAYNIADGGINAVYQQNSSQPSGYGHPINSIHDANLYARNFLKFSAGSVGIAITRAAEFTARNPEIAIPGSTLAYVFPRFALGIGGVIAAAQIFNRPAGPSRVLEGATQAATFGVYYAAERIPSIFTRSVRQTTIVKPVSPTGGGISNRMVGVARTDAQFRSGIRRGTLSLDRGVFQPEAAITPFGIGRLKAGRRKFFITTSGDNYYMREIVPSRYKPSVRRGKLEDFGLEEMAQFTKKQDPVTLLSRSGGVDISESGKVLRITGKPARAVFGQAAVRYTVLGRQSSPFGGMSSTGYSQERVLAYYGSRAQPVRDVLSTIKYRRAIATDDTGIGYMSDVIPQYGRTTYYPTEIVPYKVDRPLTSVQESRKVRTFIQYEPPVAVIAQQSTINRAVNLQPEAVITQRRIYTAQKINIASDYELISFGRIGESVGKLFSNKRGSLYGIGSLRSKTVGVNIPEIQFGGERLRVPNYEGIFASTPRLTYYLPAISRTYDRSLNYPSKERMQNRRIERSLPSIEAGLRPMYENVQAPSVRTFERSTNRNRIRSRINQNNMLTQRIRVQQTQAYRFTSSAAYISIPPPPPPPSIAPPSFSRYDDDFFFPTLNRYKEPKSPIQRRTSLFYQFSGIGGYNPMFERVGLSIRR